jgi:iron complex outermembrane recepter protein
VPGLNVASVNAREWAISARGFNNLYANKLLVLVDGRSVYKPLFAGVYWDLQQIMLEDVDRIEVIRGPGSTVWGANAVNGVINVESRSARDSQGGLLYFNGGGVERSTAGVRYGGRVGGETYYRIFASQLSRDDYTLANGESAADSWNGWHAGLHVDTYSRGDTRLTWQAEATGARLSNHASDGLNVNTLGRWTRQMSSRSMVQAQIYFDRDQHDDLARAHSIISTTDFSLHHRLGIGDSNDLIWGFGYRHMDITGEQTNAYARVLDPQIGMQLFSGFVQNEVQIVPDALNLTFGSKIEHNDLTGFELQPGVRSVFKPTANQTLWAAGSRAVRTPNVVEGKTAAAVAYGEPFRGPGGGVYVPTLIGNPELKSDVVWTYELGYRARISRRVSVDLTAFQNDYRHLITFGEVRRLVPGVPFGVAEIPWRNLISGRTRGGEVAVNLSVSSSWRLAGSYALLTHRFGPKHADTEALKGNSPRHQATLRSLYDFSPRLNADTQIRYVGHIPGVPGYVGADVRLAYRLTDQIDVALVGKNLLDPRHPEQATAPFSVVAESPRNVSVKISWRF